MSFESHVPTTVSRFLTGRCRGVCSLKGFRSHVPAVVPTLANPILANPFLAIVFGQPILAKPFLAKIRG